MLDMKLSKGLLMAAADMAATWGITTTGAHKWLRENDFSASVVGNRTYLKPEQVRAALKARGYVFKKQVICIQMLKGGVGKTTTALNIGLRASMYGARVLMVDLDQQANLSFSLGLNDEKQAVWANVLEGDVKVQSVIHSITSHLHIIPSNLNNSVLDKILMSAKRNIASALSQGLSPVMKDYDLVIIDTAPNLSAINTAAACASDLVILPVNPDKFSFDGLAKTFDDLKEIQAEFSQSFDIKVLFTKFDRREISSNGLLKSCLAEYGDVMINSFVRTSSEFKNVMRSGKTIFSHKGTAKEDYDTVTREVLGLETKKLRAN
jgi:chromosome partitioning protein